MKQKTFFNRTFVILIGLIICISLILCFYVCDQQVNAETAIWEKIDYEEISFKEDSTNFSLYLIQCTNSQFIRYKYFYIFVSGAGGMGGCSDENNAGYGGGSGAMIALKVDRNSITHLIFLMGKGGGTFDHETAESEYGEGFQTHIIALYSVESTIKADQTICYGGKAGNSTTQGKGGSTEKNKKNSFISVLHSQNGADGGQSSSPFSVDLGFRSQYFIFRPAGSNLSGKGGGASVFHRGGDGGLLYLNGSNGIKGAGGGGASKGTKQGGYGGDAYIEVYGSNM